MDKPIENYWRLRLEDLKNALEENNFEVFLADDAQAAGKLVLEKIIPELKPNTVSWGGSMTCMSAGVFEALNNNDA